MEDHLDSINENTNEIQSNYEYLCELDNKFSKLNERLDELQRLLETAFNKKTPSRYDISNELNIQEQEVFIRLYTLAESNTLSATDISRKTGLPPKMVKENIAAIRQKGIPIREMTINSKIGYYLDHGFKDFQAKNNVVKVSDKLIKHLNL